MQSEKKDLKSSLTRKWTFPSIVKPELREHQKRNKEGQRGNKSKDNINLPAPLHYSAKVKRNVLHSASRFEEGEEERGDLGGGWGGFPFVVRPRDKAVLNEAESGWGNEWGASPLVSCLGKHARIFE